jgi:nucleoside-diphosphate-sugar epimerase
MPPTVLVTGATGFVGGAFTARLLDARADVEVIAAARETLAQPPAARVVTSVRRFSDALPETYAARMSVIPCDLGHADDLDRLPLARVTHVVHFAADASGTGRAVNVDATAALARAALCGGRLERFVYVGSAWACGRGRRGVVREDEPPAGAPLFPYLADKRIAERLLAEIPGLPLLVVRPSLVVGHTTRGCEPSASLFWALRVVARAERKPWASEHQLDAVPVDWLAAAIDGLLFGPAPAHRVLHLSAGEASPTWGEIQAAFGRSGQPHAQCVQPPMPLDAWCAAMADEHAGAAHVGPLLHRCLRFLAGEAVFDGTRARAAGVTAPPGLPAYVDVCLQRARGRTPAEQANDDA